MTFHDGNDDVQLEATISAQYQHLASSHLNSIIVVAVSTSEKYWVANTSVVPSNMPTTFEVL